MMQAWLSQSECSRGIAPLRAAVLLAAAWGAIADVSAQQPSTGKKGDPLAGIPFEGERAYGYLKAICALGPRVTGSEGMAKQQAMLATHFEELGGKVEYQRFRARHPQTGRLVSMANLIVQWHPDTANRILLCAHYDTRPLPDRDPDFRNRRSGTFLGANDGASGVALLMELAHAMSQLSGNYGVDFVLLDAEEFVFDEKSSRYFLGSEWFARQYVENPPKHRYRWGVLLDMVGDANLEIYQERNSMSWRDTQPLVLEIWETARQLGVREFIPRRKHAVNDDHLKLRNLGKIPTCDVIDFDYPTHGNRYWHTTRDTPENCSAESLGKVGAVIYAWLERAK